MTIIEDWRPIPGFDGMYEISRFAEVRSWKPRGGEVKVGNRAKKPRPVRVCVCRMKKRFWSAQVTLSKGGEKSLPFEVKYLMRDIWMDGPLPGKIVSFRDGDQANCALHNLYYTTQAKLNQTRPSAIRKPVAKLINGKITDWYESKSEAARKNHLSLSGLCHRIDRGTVVDGVEFKIDGVYAV